MNRLIATTLFVVGVIGPVSLLHGQGTSFTYQGQLKEAGAPASGSYDMKFRVFDADVDGNQYGADFPIKGVTVADGLFTVILDFGTGVFTGVPLWLEIEVNTFVLAPRQPLTATPYAQTCNDAYLSTFSYYSYYAYAPWVPTGSDLYYVDGNVGIGTTEPTAKLDVAGEPGVDGIRFPDGSLQTTAAIGGGGDSIWSQNGIHAYYNAGNVGVGTSVPDGKLHVAGGPLWTSSSWAKSLAINNAGAIELGYGGTTRFGIGASANALYFFRTTTEGTDAAANYFMFADSSGNVGINTLTPSAKLHVRNTGLFSGGDAVRGDTTAHRGVVGTASDLAGIAGEFTNSAGGTALKAGGSVVVENSGDGAELLRFDTERPWVFRQIYTGPSTGLQLKATSGLKNFEITCNNDVNVATFLTDTANPRVGIGTTTPVATLDVNGTTRTRVLQIVGADLAEKFPTSDCAEPGMVMEIDPEKAGLLRMSQCAYNQRVAGVVSGANDFPAGAILGNLPGNEDAPPIALSGRVWTWCDASEGSISPGDLLTTSLTPGHAMKSVDRERSHGAVIGKAMTSLKSGRGLVLVLVNLQ